MGSIVVVNRHGGERAEIQAVLSRLGHEICGADSHAGALDAIQERSPLLVVLKLETGGLMLCREIIDLFDGTPVIVISSERTTAADRVAGLLVGADDYICEPFDPDELVARVRRTIVRRADSSGRHVASLSSMLSPREREVLGMLSDGLTQRQIAAQLVISSKTVGTHVQHILSKLGVHSRAQAVAYALSRELGS